MAEDSGKETVDQIKAELERVNRALVMAKSEAGDSRKQLEKIEAEKAEKDKAALSEIEKLQVEVKAGRQETSDLKAKLNAADVRTAIITEATKLGFASPEDAMALIDLSAVETTDGKVTGFEKSLKALAESGRLAMADQKRSDSLGTPLGKGKPASGAEKAPVQIRV